jgi:hypothetical protein
METIKYRWLQFVEFFETPLGNQVKFYGLFYLSLWSFHLIIISLISFFHLLLGHNIRTIGDWIGDRGWLLIIFSKITIFYLALQFIRLKSKKLNLLKSYLQNSIQLPRREVFVVIVFMLVGLAGLGRVGFNRAYIFELPRILYSIIGTLVLFSVDYALIVVFEIFFPLESEHQKRLKLVLVPLLFYAFTYITFIYEQNVSFRLYAYFFLIIYLGEWRRRNWTLPLLALTSFVVPVHSLMGLDPVWGANYTFFAAQRPVGTFSLFILIGISVGYLFWVQRKYPEYIYRE